MTGAELRHLLDRPIAFHRCFLRFGGVEAALLLSQAFYWTQRTSDPEGWFWKTQAEWEEETGLDRRDQEGARKKLRGYPFWQEKLEGLPARLYFRVDLDALAAILANCEVRKDGEFCHTGKANSAIQGRRNSPSLPYTKTTSREYDKEGSAPAPARAQARPREEPPPAAPEPNQRDPFGDEPEPEPPATEPWQEDWERFLALYPKRSGDRGVKAGRVAYGRLLKAGKVSAETLLRGCRDYRAWVDATAKTNTELVKQIPSWLNGECWQEDWTPPTAPETLLTTLRSQAAADPSGFPAAMRTERDRLLAQLRAERAARGEVPGE